MRVLELLIARVEVVGFLSAFLASQIFWRLEEELGDIGDLICFWGRSRGEISLVGEGECLL